MLSILFLRGMGLLSQKLGVMSSMLIFDNYQVLVYNLKTQIEEIV